MKCVCRRRRNRSYGSPAGSSSDALAVAAAAACGNGMESAGNGIFLRLRMTVMDSLRHMAAGGSAADGRTMSEREAWQRRSFGAARPGRGGPVQGPFGRSPVGSQAPRTPRGPGERAWSGPPGRDEWRHAGGRDGAGGARCVPGGAREPNRPGIPMSYSATQAPRDGFSPWRLARDNYCYREPNRRFKPSRPVPESLPVASRQA